MSNSPNILRPKCREQDESHPYFIFYCKLSKIIDYIIDYIDYRLHYRLLHELHFLYPF